MLCVNERATFLLVKKPSRTYLADRHPTIAPDGSDVYRIRLYLRRSLPGIAALMLQDVPGFCRLAMDERLPGIVAARPMTEAGF